MPLSRPLTLVALSLICACGGGSAVTVAATPTTPSGAAVSGAKCATSSECSGSDVCISYVCQSPPSGGAPAATAASAGQGAPVSCPAGTAPLKGGSFKPLNTDTKETVTISPLCMDVTEVTVDAFKRCVKDGKCTVDPAPKDRDDSFGVVIPGCNYSAAGHGNHPMNCVSWDESYGYCKAQGKRLPTQEEWEWAARGGAEARAYPWGEETPKAQLCWSGGGTQQTGTCPVGSFHAGDAPGGIHDLLGNVQEWTFSKRQDWREVRGESFRGVGSVGIGPSSFAAQQTRRAPELGFRCVK